MAKARRKRSTSAPPPADKPPSFKATPIKAPPELVAALKMPPGWAEAWRKIFRAQRGREQPKLDEARKEFDRILAIDIGLLPPPWKRQPRRAPKREPAQAVARVLWPPNGRPPRNKKTVAATAELADEIKKRGLNVPERPTLERAIGRRKR
jgi:hypothetical protein